MPSTGVLPASGLALHLREPTGDDELFLLSGGPPPATMLELASRLGRDLSGRSIDWLELPAVDLGGVALLIRSAWIGERIHTETLCPERGCAEPIDVSFLISDYLSHHRPRPPRGVVAQDDGWFGLAGLGVSFRVPTIGDTVVAMGEQREDEWLAGRCIRPADPNAAARLRVERALERIAPRLDDHVSGRCPACGTDVELFFDPVSYVAAELRDVSAGLFADVHELAFAYRWSEASILSLDRRRRHSYVAMVRGELALA
jgi:hypothetical protein